MLEVNRAPAASTGGKTGLPQSGKPLDLPTQQPTGVGELPVDAERRHRPVLPGHPPRFGRVGQAARQQIPPGRGAEQIRYEDHRDTVETGRLAARDNQQPGNPGDQGCSYRARHSPPHAARVWLHWAAQDEPSPAHGTQPLPEL